MRPPGWLLAPSLLLLAACAPAAGAQPPVVERPDIKAAASEQTGSSAYGCDRPAPTAAEGWTGLLQEQHGAWAGGDGTFTVPLADGRVLWMFGDSYDLRNPSGPRMVSNVLAVTDGACFTVANPGRAFLPTTEDGRFYWPYSAVSLGADRQGVETLVVFAHENTRVGPDPFDFEGTGAVAAEVRVTAGALPTLIRMVPLTQPDAGTTSGVIWGAAATSGPDGYAYVFGTHDRRERMVFGRDLLLARARPQDLLDPGAWRYRTASGWSADPSAAVPVHPAVGGVSTALSATYLDGRYVLVTKKDEMVGDQVVALTSPHPWGPFTETLLFSSPTTSTTMTYLASAHPALDSPPGTIQVSVNRMPVQMPFAPDDYKATFTTVPLSTLLPDTPAA